MTDAFQTYLLKLLLLLLPTLSALCLAASILILLNFVSFDAKRPDFSDTAVDFSKCVDGKNCLHGTCTPSAISKSVAEACLCDNHHMGFQCDLPKSFDAYRADAIQLYEARKRMSCSHLSCREGFRCHLAYNNSKSNITASDLKYTHVCGLPTPKANYSLYPTDANQRLNLSHEFNENLKVTKYSVKLHIKLTANFHVGDFCNSEPFSFGEHKCPHNKHCIQWTDVYEDFYKFIEPVKQLYEYYMEAIGNNIFANFERDARNRDTAQRPAVFHLLRMPGAYCRHVPQALSRMVAAQPRREFYAANRAHRNGNRKGHTVEVSGNYHVGKFHCGKGEARPTKKKDWIFHEGQQPSWLIFNCTDDYSEFSSEVAKFHTLCQPLKNVDLLLHEHNELFVKGFGLVSSNKINIHNVNNLIKEIKAVEELVRFEPPGQNYTVVRQTPAIHFPLYYHPLEGANQTNNNGHVPLFSVEMEDVDHFLVYSTDEVADLLAQITSGNGKIKHSTAAERFPTCANLFRNGSWPNDLIDPCNYTKTRVISDSIPATQSMLNGISTKNRQCITYEQIHEVFSTVVYDINLATKYQNQSFHISPPFGDGYYTSFANYYDVQLRLKNDKMHLDTIESLVPNCKARSGDKIGNDRISPGSCFIKHFETTRNILMRDFTVCPDVFLPLELCNWEAVWRAAVEDITGKYQDLHAEEVAENVHTQEIAQPSIKLRMYIGINDYYSVYIPIARLKQEMHFECSNCPYHGPIQRVELSYIGINKDKIRARNIFRNISFHYTGYIRQNQSIDHTIVRDEEIINQRQELVCSSRCDYKPGNRPAVFFDERGEGAFGYGSWSSWSKCDPCLNTRSRFRLLGEVNPAHAFLDEELSNTEPIVSEVGFCAAMSPCQRFINSTACNKHGEFRRLACYESNLCIGVARVCDGIQDCPNQWDEVDCLQRSGTKRQQYADVPAADQMSSGYDGFTGGKRGRLFDFQRDSGSGEYFELINNTKVRRPVCLGSFRRIQQLDANLDIARMTSAAEMFKLLDDSYERTEKHKKMVDYNVLAGLNAEYEGGFVKSEFSSKWGGSSETVTSKNTKQSQQYKEAHDMDMSFMVIESKLQTYEFFVGGADSGYDFQFAKAITELPYDFHADSYLEFIKYFGTHYVRSGILGGHFKIVYKYEKSQAMSEADWNSYGKACAMQDVSSFFSTQASLEGGYNDPTGRYGGSGKAGGGYSMDEKHYFDTCSEHSEKGRNYKQKSQESKHSSIYIRPLPAEGVPQLPTDMSSFTGDSHTDVYPNWVKETLKNPVLIKANEIDSICTLIRGSIVEHAEVRRANCFLALMIYRSKMRPNCNCPENTTPVYDQQAHVCSCFDLTNFENKNLPQNSEEQHEKK